MRDFLNAPNGSSKQSMPVNERLDSDSSHSPLGGKTVIYSFTRLQLDFLFTISCYAKKLKLIIHTLQDVFDLPFHMGRDQIEESLRAKIAFIKV